MTMTWSAAKEEVFRLESNIAVSAGAGSGKTAALVELYLRLLAGETSLSRPLEVDEIVAITFTEKAAAEMRERVRSGAAVRYKATGLPRWHAVQRELSHARISTFHSLCANLLRNNAAEAGIDPSFEVMDDLAARSELEAALDDVIREELQTKSPEIMRLLSIFPLSARGKGNGLREHLLSLHRKRSVAGTDLGSLLQRMHEWNLEAEFHFHEKTKDLKGLMPDVSRILSGKAAAFHARLQPLPALVQQNHFQITDLGLATRLLMMQKCIAGNWYKEKPVKDQLLAALETMVSCTCQVALAEHSAALLKLMGLLERRYHQRKDRRGMLDFEDLQTKTRDLLRKEDGLRQRYRQQFAVVMVDEFQDTNLLQKELVTLLTGKSQRLFLVGDPKQSIYLFRGADVSIFTATRREMEGTGGKSLFFQENFRSRPGIIRFVNGLFAAIMGETRDDHNVAYGAGDHLEAKREDIGEEGCVELLALPDGLNASAKRQAEARAIAAQVAVMVAGAKDIVIAGESPHYRDMAILFRRFSHIKTFEAELRAAGIPYYVVKGKGFYQCQEVLDLLNFLRYLEHGGDLVSLAGLLRSPLCGVSDETLYLLGRDGKGISEWSGFLRHGEGPAFPESWELVAAQDRTALLQIASLIQRLALHKDRLTLAELIEEVIGATGFSSILLATYQGEQKGANVRKLVDFARSYSKRGGGLRSFIIHMGKLVESEPTEAEAVIAAENDDVVKLMTVHQSKGLEFPIVFLPEIGSNPPLDHSPILYDDRLGVGLKIRPCGSEGMATLSWNAIASQQQERLQAEQKRLLYVAVTRARDHLILSGEGRGAWRQWIDLALEKGLVTPAKTVSFTAPAPAEKLMKSGIKISAGKAIDYQPPLPSSLVFSPTALEDYANCPRKYFYKGVLGLDEGLFAELLGDRKGARTRWELSPLEKGNIGHLMLQHLDFSSPAQVQKELCQRIAATIIGTTNADTAEVVEQVLAFAASPTGQELAHMEVYREYPFVLKLSGKADYYVKGTMDAVAMKGSRIRVIDYKYLRRDDQDLSGYRFQLATYLLALAKGFPGKSIEGELIFLRGGAPERVDVDTDSFACELLRLMEEVRERSTENDFDLKKECDGTKCPFRDRCQPRNLRAEAPSKPQQLSLLFAQ